MNLTSRVLLSLASAAALTLVAVSPVAAQVPPPSASPSASPVAPPPASASAPPQASPSAPPSAPPDPAQATPPSAAPSSPEAAPDPAAAATKDATELLYNTGIEAAGQGDWEKAYQSFHAAWRVRQHFQIAANLGRAAVKTGRFGEAAEHLSFALREGKDISQEDRAALQQLLYEAQRHLGALIIKVNRPGAEVLVDGRPVGIAPLPEVVYVAPGSHKVEARLGKQKAMPTTVELKAGDSRQVGLRLGEEKSTPRGQPKSGGQPPGPQDGGGPNKWVLIAGGTATGVGLILGIAGTVAANKAVGEHDRVSPEEELPSNLAFWSFLGAGVVAGATVTYALVSPRRPAEKAAVRLLPVAGPEGGGVALRGRW